MRTKSIISLFLAITFSAGTVFAGFMGHNAKGDFGLMSGTQLPPGFYAIPLYYRYDGDSIKNQDGDSIQIDPEGRGSLDLNAYVLGMYWVSDFKILGANYSFQLYGALADNVLDVPILDLQQSVDTNISDSYCQPINLGWHTDRTDFSTGLGVYIPTGEYDPEGSENTGLGMWSFELFAGTTL